jgi:hypothetical protein
MNHLVRHGGFWELAEPIPDGCHTSNHLVLLRNEHNF